MPLYTFKCVNCNGEEQKLLPIIYCDNTTVCPYCGALDMSRVFTNSQNVTHSSKDRLAGGKDAMVYKDIRENMSKKFGIKEQNK